MVRILDCDGIIVNKGPRLGNGKQGWAELATLASDPDIKLVAKHIPLTEDARKRTQALVHLALPSLSPFLAAPIAMNVDQMGEIMHLAPFAEGHDFLDDNRTFPENMEIAYHFSCLNTILEDAGLAHGDLGEGNIIITKKGAVYLIDFDNFASTDPNVPSPTMAGHLGMMPPELFNGSGQTPNMQTDRFGYGVFCNLIMLRRHPAQDASVPAEVKRVLSTGIWPERSRPFQTGDVPIEALGGDLPRLFDDAFSLDPDIRPSADMWRRAISNALRNMVIHDCGQAFVQTNGQNICPWCQTQFEAPKLEPLTQNTITKIKIYVPGTGARYGVELRDGKPIILGRSNLGSGAQSVSAKHLEILPVGDKLFLKHIGRYPTQLLKDGDWYELHSDWVKLADMTKAPITLKLADLPIDIEAG